MKKEPETEFHQYRIKAGLSLNQISKLTGLSYTILWRADKGLEGVGLLSKKKIAKALNQDIFTLFPEILKGIHELQAFVPKSEEPEK